MANTGDRITRKYNSFRGVDFRGEDINLVRSPDALNVWKDYKEVDSIRTRPGMKLHTAFDDTIHGIFFYNGQTLIHSGTKLYKVNNGAKTEIYSGVANAKSNAFIYENTWYFMDGQNYLQYNGTALTEVIGYVPTTSIARKPGPDGGGTIYEDVNMLTGHRKNSFLSDDTNKVYRLDSQNIDKDFEPVVTLEKGLEINYEVDFDNGIITFDSPPPKPTGTDGRDNVVIEFKKVVKGYRESILNCTLLQVFDNRVFVSGNADYPNVVWHCSLNDPTYFSDLDFYREGMDTAKVKGLVAGNNALWVFREPSEANTTVFYHTPTIDSEYGKIYPNTHSSITTGCIGRAINFNDDIVFFSERGMEGINGDVTTEQAIAHRSILVDRLLTKEKDYANMILEEWEGYLFIFIGDKAYLADSRGIFTNGNHIEYEFFYWQMEKPITCAKVNDGILYLGTADGLYTLTDTTAEMESYWVTPKDKFEAPQMQKTTNKRGCVAEATGDISVYAKLEDTGYELIGTYEGVTDFFVSRIKRKKFKDIQLKFHSNTRFSLESVTLECFIGGYIKR